MTDSPTLDERTSEPDTTPAVRRERTVAGMPVRLLVTGTLVALILAAAAGALVALSQDDGDVVDLGGEATGQQPNGAVIGLPVAVPYASFDGEALNTGRHVGTPIVLNFFAEWCAPCREEMPAFESVHQDLDGEVHFLGISTDRLPADGLALVASTGITFEVGRDQGGEAWDLFAGTSMPTTVLIDAAGTVRTVESRPLTAPQLRALIDEHFG